MDTEHRKIELQSPADLIFLQSQLRTAARAKLDLHLPPVSGDEHAGPDDLRRKTEELVDEFVRQMEGGIRANININGLDVGEGVGGEKSEALEVTEYEAYDYKTRDHLAALVHRRDELITKISGHRRATPGVAAQQFRERWERDVKADEVERERVVSAGGDGEVKMWEVEGLKRQADVEKSWERAVEALMGLNKGLPETRARLERCGDVVGYLHEGGKGDAS